MTAETKTVQRLECPTCGRNAKRVSPITVLAMLKDEFVLGLHSDGDSCRASDGNGQTGCTPISEDTGWRFCDSQDCEVVYFAEHGDTTIAKMQLKVEVGVKEALGERPLCYCFDHSIATIKEEIRTKGRSDALEDIRQKMKDPGCACEVTNPSGSCCLGTVGTGIETAKAELNGPTPTGSRAETISKVGTVLSAIMASACCWLPLTLLAFGVSGAGIAGALDAYRPLFIVLTFGFLAAAFYFTYRPPKGASASEDCCATPNPTSKSWAESPSDDCCAVTPATKTRFTMMTLNKVMLLVVTVMAVAFLFFPNYMKFFMSGGGVGESATNNPLVRTTIFSVQGMTCEGCSALVENAIKKVPGVLSVKMDYEWKRAVVTSEECCPAPTEAVIDAVQAVGYRATVVETDGAGKAKTAENPPPSAKVNAKQIDPERQIVFAVRRFT